MNGHVVVERLTRSIATGAIACAFAATALADSRPLADTVTITVFADRYTVGDRAYDDISVLEKDITARPFHSVMLLICGPGATRSLKAVVHRFRHVPVQMRVPDIDEPDCMSRASLVMAVHEGSGQRPFGIDDEAVERYWLDLMP